METDVRGTTRRVAAIDLGTVSSRLSLAELEGARIASAHKHTIITDLGAGVDATGRFRDDAVARVVEACRGFVDEARTFGACCTCTTLTSAARDAANSEDLLTPLRALGLEPQVIPGETEARLTFYGVAHDFAGERIVVADSGGGSTELAVGCYDAAARTVALDQVASLNIGCRRVTDRFLPADPPAQEDEAAAATWAAAQFQPYWDACASRPDRLVAVGGTATTLVAMVHELAVYDSSFVHLRELTLEEVDGCVARLRGMAAADIAQLPGIQAKRAPVIRAGAIVLAELMRTGGYRSLTVSENSLLAGAAYTMGEALEGQEPAIGWTPALAPLAG